MKIAAIALAAGLSRRMGKQNKLLLDFAGKKLFEYTADRLAGGDFSQKIIVANDAAIKCYSEAKGLVVTANPASEQGVSTSIKAGIGAAGPADGYMFFNCDQPLLRDSVIGRLLTQFKCTDKIIVPRCAGECCSPVIFPARFKAQLLALAGDTGGKAVYSKHPAQVQYAEFAERRDFLDIDVLGDRENILRMAAAGLAGKDDKMNTEKTDK